MSARLILLWIAAAFTALWVAGCHEETAHQEERLALFQEGKGIRLNDEMKKLLGVEFCDVAEKTVTPTFTQAAEVYAVNGKLGRATMRVDESTTNLVTPGQPVLVTFAVNSTTGTVATVERPAPSLKEATIEFPNRMAVTPGDVVVVTIRGEPRTATVVPLDAVLSTADGDYVYVVNGGHLTRAKVTRGAAFDGWVEILDGLYPGDSVAATAVNSLWYVELSALKGGKPCCAVPKKS